MRRWAVVGLVVILGASCGDDDVPPASTTTTTTTTTGAGGGMLATIEVAVLAEDAVNDAPVAGAEICILDSALPCSVTGPDGRATVTAPANAAIWATLVADKYVGAVVGALTGEDDLSLTAPLINANLTDLVAGSANQRFDPNKGQLGFVAFMPLPPNASQYPPAPGVTIALDPASGSGPHYVNNLNLADPALTATGEAGGALWLNVEPGTSELRTTLDAATCGHLVAQPLGDDRFAVLTMPGFVTYLTVVCTPDDPGTGGGGTGGAGGMGTGGAGGTGGR